MSVPAISPLALTDDELGKIYKAISATGIRGGVRVERREVRPSERGKGKSPMLFRVVAAAKRVGGEEVLAHTRKSLNADVIAHAFNNLAFLIESLQSERASVDKEREKINCVAAVLDAKGVPADIAPGQPYSLHGRVAAALKPSVPNVLAIGVDAAVPEDVAVPEDAPREAYCVCGGHIAEHEEGGEGTRTESLHRMPGGHWHQLEPSVPNV